MADKTSRIALDSKDETEGMEGGRDIAFEVSTASASTIPAPIILNNEKESATSNHGQDELSTLEPFKIYNPPSSQSSTLASIGATLPDDSDYFKPTPADLKLAQDSLAQRTKALQDAPLLTAKLRSEKDEEKKTRFPTATIRIKFANRTMLEKVFPSSDRIISVYRFVRACLNEEARSHKFVLFSSPPRRDFKVSDPEVKEKTLLDLRLAPQSNLFFRFFDDSITLDNPGFPPPLLQSLLAQSVSLPTPSTLPVTMGDAGQSDTGLSSKNTTTERKIPKWLKLSKKT
ncbi:hypothetical protein SCHPADRAFT_910797 [Schizopora paradoxa]|uniref:UBX domain-containing protein n=1 Tax=Schizopora paradoxa TaxID=27342 RepID=A0A0H2R8B4_9AGAM|nr:hypothetical protein SCHPADRAFT_910797 [Schizopora paradoxa]